VDLACLGEIINTHLVPGDTMENAETIPGPSYNRLADKAKKYGMYVTAGLTEKNNGLLYNTNVLIDRAGDLVGKYKKTHLTIGEGLLSGKVPGDHYPIFHTDLGKIGIMICYDNHFPEVARILAVKGADIILYSNMGDGREDGTLWESYIRTRAMDNHVHIVAAVNKVGQTCIVSPLGELLDKAENKPGAIAIADCDLNSTVRNHTNRPIGKRYLQTRRPETYDLLTRPLFHLEPYSRVRLI
jgi:predicted amidohydrolase